MLINSEHSYCFKQDLKRAVKQAKDRVSENKKYKIKIK